MTHTKPTPTPLVAVLPDESPSLTPTHDPLLEQRVRQHEAERRQTVAPRPAPRPVEGREPYGYD